MKKDAAHPISASSAPGLPPGVTVPARELHLLLEGVREWYERKRLEGPKESAADEASPSRHGCLGILSGEAGLGKSLLIESLKQVCSTLDLKCAVAECNSCTGEPLAAILSLLINLLGHPEERERSLEQLSPLQRAVLRDLDPQLISDKGSCAHVHGLSPGMERLRLVDVLAGVFVNLAEEKPLLLMVESIHLLDQLSAEVLTTCLRMVQQRHSQTDSPRLLLVATYDSAEITRVEKVADLFSSKSLAFEIQLRGYSRADFMDACESFGVVDLPLSRREQIYHLTGGNPLLINWLLRSLHADGNEQARIQLARKRISFENLIEFRYQHHLASLERGLVDLLSFTVRPIRLKDIFTLASGVGFLVFNSDALQELRSLSVEELQSICFRLEREGWIRGTQHADGERRWRVADCRAVETLRKKFDLRVVAQIHEAIGETLLRSARETGTDSGPFDVFHYFDASGRAEPEVLIEVGLEAARQCEKRCAWDRSIEIRDKVLEHLKFIEPAQRLELLTEQALLLEATGIYQEAVDIYKGLISGDFLELTGQDKVNLYRRVALLHGRLSERSEEVQTYRVILNLLENDAGNIEAVKTCVQLAAAYLDMGLAPEAELLVNDVTVGLDESNVPHTDLLEVYERLEDVYFKLGRYEAAIETEKRTYELSSEHRCTESFIESTARLSYLRFLGSDYDRAIRHLREGLEAAAQSGSRCLEARSKIHLGRLLRSQGYHHDALQVFSQARDTMVELGLEGLTRKVHCEIIRLQLQLFRLDGASVNLETVVNLSEDPKERTTSVSVFPPAYSSHEERSRKVAELRRSLDEGLDDEGVVLRSLGDFLIDLGSMKETIGIYSQVMKSSKVNGNPIALAVILQRVGCWYRIKGQFSDALRFFEKSLEYLGPVPERSVVGNAYLEVGNILAIQGNLSTAYGYIVRGLGIFLEMDDVDGEEVALLSLSRFFREIGCRRTCAQFAELVTVLCQRSGHKRWEAEGYCLLGALASERRDFNRSAKYFSRAKLIYDVLGLKRELLYLEMDRGWECVRKRDFHQGREKARQCLESARELEDQRLLQDGLHLSGVVDSVLENRGKNFLRAVEVLEQALLATKSAKRALASRRILLSLARLYAERGKKDLAGEYVAEERALAGLLRPRVPEAFWSAYRDEAAKRTALNEGPSARLESVPEAALSS